MARQRKRKGDPVHGWLNLDKPVDMTSTQAVGVVRRLFNAQKAGHGGTLDPLADGILPIALGEATKTVAWAMDAEKEYIFTIAWGASTDSQDLEGAVIATSEHRPTREAIEAALPTFIGEIEQIPPKYSAIKVDGERAYDLARDGEAFELEGRPVTVYEASVTDMPDGDHTVIHVRSGKGCYVRARARDLARALGAEGHISQLRRTRVGAFSETEAISLADLKDLAETPSLMSALRPIEMALDTIPALAITSADASMLKQGRAIVLLPHIAQDWRERIAAAEDEDRLAVAMVGDQPVALGEVRAGRFQPTRVFQI